MLRYSAGFFLAVSFVFVTSSFAADVAAKKDASATTTKAKTDSVDPGLAKVQFTKLPKEHKDNNTIKSFSDLKGKVVVVDFWASWCAPCAEALPHYNKLSEKFKNKNVVFVGMNEDDSPLERDGFLKDHKIDFSVFFDTDHSIAKDFQVLALPTLFVFDKNMKPVFYYRGFDSKDTTTLEKTLEKLTQ